MTGWIFAAAFLIAAVIFLVLYLKQRKFLFELESFTDSRLNGERRKMFACGNSVEARIVFGLNKLTEKYDDEITDCRKAAESGDMLLTALSHDVRTPITSLIGYLQALRTDILTETERAEYLSVCGAKAEGIRQYVDILFDWFKLNSNEMKFDPEQTDINEFMRQVVISWIPQFKEKQIDVSTEIPDDVFTLNLDTASMRRAVDNVIRNALTHSECKSLNISVLKSDSAVKIEISDDGKGIPAEHINRIFERLYKCDGARRDRGCGLGLAIAREIAVKHGGNLEVFSVPFVKTTFTFTLPL